MAMAAVMLGIVLVVSLASFVGLWILIEGETSNPTVVDREEAERRAIEQGGRRQARTSDAEHGRSNTDTEHDDDSVGWD